MLHVDVDLNTEFFHPLARAFVSLAAVTGAATCGVPATCASLSSGGGTCQGEGPDMHWWWSQWVNGSQLPVRWCDGNPKNAMLSLLDSLMIFNVSEFFHPLALCLCVTGVLGGNSHWSCYMWSCCHMCITVKRRRHLPGRRAGHALMMESMSQWITITSAMAIQKMQCFQFLIA